jgi:hypothetical protein
MGGDPPVEGGVVDAVRSDTSFADDVAGGAVLAHEQRKFTVDLGERCPVRVGPDRRRIGTRPSTLRTAGGDLRKVVADLVGSLGRPVG